MLVQTSPEAHPTYSTSDVLSFLDVKGKWPGADHPPYSSAEVVKGMAPFCAYIDMLSLYHNIDQIYQCVLSDYSTTMSCIVELHHPCAVRICVVLGTALLLRRDVFLIMVNYLTLGIHKTVSLNLLNLNHNAEDYVEMILTLKYLSPYMVF